MLICYRSENAMLLFSQDGSLSNDEIEKHADLFLSTAKKQQSEQKANSKPKDGRCPHAHRRGQKAKDANNVNDVKDVKDELWK